MVSLNIDPFFEQKLDFSILLFSNAANQSQVLAKHKLLALPVDRSFPNLSAFILLYLSKASITIVNKKSRGY